ncbi:hypothetical protein QYF36_023674 [Acer negundo]|nr:hypothetical protein QYF36_023674 [Acer negundo]
MAHPQSIVNGSKHRVRRERNLVVTKEAAKDRRSKTLKPAEVPRTYLLEKMIIDGPSSGPAHGSTPMDSLMTMSDTRPQCDKQENVCKRTGKSLVEGQPKSLAQENVVINQHL